MHEGKRGKHEGSEGKNDRREPDEEEFRNGDVIFRTAAKVFNDVKTMTLYDVVKTNVDGRYPPANNCIKKHPLSFV